MMTKESDQPRLRDHAGRRHPLRAPRVPRHVRHRRPEGGHGGLHREAEARVQTQIRSRIPDRMPSSPPFRGHRAQTPWQSATAPPGRLTTLAALRTSPRSSREPPYDGEGRNSGHGGHRGVHRPHRASYRDIDNLLKRCSQDILLVACHFQSPIKRYFSTDEEWAGNTGPPSIVNCNSTSRTRPGHSKDRRHTGHCRAEPCDHPCNHGFAKFSHGNSRQS